MPQRISYAKDQGHFFEEEPDVMFPLLPEDAWRSDVVFSPPPEEVWRSEGVFPSPPPWLPPTLETEPPTHSIPPVTPPTFTPTLPPIPPGEVTPQPVPVTSTPSTGAATPPHATTPPPPPPFEGFDFRREQRPETSAKDAFATLARTAPPPPLGDRNALGQWFRQYIAPGMTQLGHVIDWVDGDKFQFSNWQGTWVVDFGRGAGGPGGALVWQAETPSAYASGVFDHGTTGIRTSTDTGTSGRGSASGGGGAGTGSGRSVSASGTDTSQPFDDVLSQWQALGRTYAGPGEPGIAQGPVQQVGQDPLSQAITGAMMTLMGHEGATRDGAAITDALLDIIRSGGALPHDSTTARQQYESARELLAKAERTMRTAARAALADRGLLSEPGAPSGQEAGMIRRIAENIAPEFARAVRDIVIEDQRTRQTRLMEALQLATGMTQQHAQTLLATARTATERQQMLSDIALRALAQNQAWSVFLAEFGLSRDRVLHDIQSGNLAALLPLMQLFLQTAGLARGGYV